MNEKVNIYITHHHILTYIFYVTFYSVNGNEVPGLIPDHTRIFYGITRSKTESIQPREEN